MASMRLAPQPTGPRQSAHPELIPAKHPAAAWRVNRMIRKVQKQNPAMASGLMVWLHTLRASDVPELRLAGRELWGQ